MEYQREPSQELILIDFQHLLQVNQGKMCIDLFRDRSDLQVLRNIISNYASQDSYYCNENGEIIVDHIAEFENLQNEFIFLCDQVGIKAPSLQHGNKSSNSHNMYDIYNQELIDLVAKKEKSVMNLRIFCLRYNIYIQCPSSIHIYLLLSRCILRWRYVAAVIRQLFSSPTELSSQLRNAVKWGAITTFQPALHFS